MLQIPNLLYDEEANNIIIHFINDRIIDLMETIILDEVEWGLAMDSEIDLPNDNVTFDDIVDIDKLMADLKFAKNVSLDYLPEGFPIGKANSVFLGLYKLLKAEDEYVPELPMEYALAHIIAEEIYEIDQINSDMNDEFFSDFFAEMAKDPLFEGIQDEEYSTVKRFPDKEREIIRRAAREVVTPDPDESIEEVVDFILNSYEDLREYLETCFWDCDYMLLDDYNEEELANSALNEYMGIMPPKDNIIQFPIKNENGEEIQVKAEINLAPWDNRN